MPDTFATILLNVSDDDRRWFHGFSGHHPLEVVFTYAVLEPELFCVDGDARLFTNEHNLDVCEQAFKLFNAPEEFLTPTEQGITISYRARQLRSLSVGDVVCVTRPGSTNFFACQSMGWKRLDRSPGYVRDHAVLPTKEKLEVLALTLN